MIVNVVGVMSALNPRLPDLFGGDRVVFTKCDSQHQSGVVSGGTETVGPFRYVYVVAGGAVFYSSLCLLRKIG